MTTIAKSIRKTKVVPDYEQEPFENVVIRCPKCGTVQAAKEFPDRKVFKKMHRCTGCNFLIRKDDWHPIK